MYSSMQDIAFEELMVRVPSKFVAGVKFCTPEKTIVSLKKR